MSFYVEAITDEVTGLAVSGAEVFVYDDNNALATLYAADGTTEVDNPLTTNADGEFSFYSPTTELTAVVYYGGRLRRRLRLLVGGGYSLLAAGSAQASLAGSGALAAANMGAGLAGTAIGETFWLNNGDGTGATYRHDAGPVATEISKFIIDPTSSGAAALLGTSGGTVQEFIDDISDTADGKGASIVATDDGKNAQQHINILTRASAITPQDYADVTPTDWASTLQDTIDAALTEGKNVEIPEVTAGYEIGSQVLIKPDLFFDSGSGAFGAFSPGPTIRGRGEGMTKLISKVANAAMFKFESDVDHTAEFGAILGLSMSNVRLSADSGTAGTSAVELQAVFGFHMHDFAIDGFKRDGIKITCDYGDLDGSVYTKLERGRIFNCERWGIDSKAAVGHNEISYLSLNQVWIQSCGTAQTFQATPSEVNYPTSGGMRWKGQMLMYANGGFTTCQGVGLFVPGESSGSASEVILDNVTHENCVGRGLLVTGCKGFRGRNLQFYNNDGYIARRQCEFYPVQSIYDVDITGGLVRATSGNNQLTAFKSTQPASADTRLRPKISQITFDNFGQTGQVGFDGIAFEACRNDCILTYPGGNIVKIEPGPQGNQVPLRLRQPVQGSAFDTGELIPHYLRASGYTADLTGLPDGTYQIYLTDAGNVVGLEVSSIAPVVDVLSGILVKPTEQKTWVGRAVMASGALVTTAAANFANAAYIKGFGYQWVDSTSAVRRKATAPTSDTDGTLV